MNLEKHMFLGEIVKNTPNLPNMDFCKTTFNVNVWLDYVYL